MKQLLLFACLTITLKTLALGTITGNGVFKSETREVGTFTGLSSGGPMNVEIVYGTSTKLNIEGDENILPYIETYVKDGTLKIKVKDFKTVRPSQPLKIHVNMTTISNLSQSGSGHIAGEGDFTNNGETTFSVSGSGNIKLSFAKFGNASLSLSGSGFMELKGAIEGGIDAHQSGSGKINCEAAPCKSVNVQMSGSGSIKVNASKAITAHISGSGNVYYTGDAGEINSHVSGSGSIRKM